jgi:uncharacterized protein RhaS with RHS repeats
LTSDGDFCYTYDNEGNRIEKKSLKSNETVKYEWDHRNRLVKVTTLKETVGYVYDYLNRMIKRNDEFWVHDGWQIVASLKNNKITHRYLWGNNQDELIATDGQFTLCDHLNSVRDIIDVRGKVTGRREYNAFGKVTRQTGKPAKRNVFSATPERYLTIKRSCSGISTDGMTPMSGDGLAKIPLGLEEEM